MRQEWLMKGVCAQHRQHVRSLAHWMSGRGCMVAQQFVDQTGCGPTSVTHHPAP